MAVCVCRPCDRRFAGLTAFDRHLRWHRKPPWVSCRAPEDVGLVWSDVRNCWATHIGPLSVASSADVAPSTDGGISPDRANCSASRGIR